MVQLLLRLHRHHHRYRRIESKTRLHHLDLAPRARMKAREGDTVVLRALGGREELEIVEVRFEAVHTDAFVPEAPISLNQVKG